MKPRIEGSERLSGEPKNSNFDGIDPLLVSAIKAVKKLEPVKLTKPLYFVKDSDRKAHPFNHDVEGLQVIGNHLKYYLRSTSLPDELLLIASSWFISHLNLIEENPDPPYFFNKSIAVYTYNIKVINDVKKLYWALRDHYFPSQACGEKGIARYEDAESLFKFWLKFHVIGLDHLSPETYKETMEMISRQNGTLFYEKWPLICIGSPKWTKQEGFYNITL